MWQAAMGVLEKSRNTLLERVQAAEARMAEGEGHVRDLEQQLTESEDAREQLHVQVRIQVEGGVQGRVPPRGDLTLPWVIVDGASTVGPGSPGA